MENLEKYGLDMHCTMILEDFIERIPVYEKMKEIVLFQLQEAFKRNNMLVTTIEARIKSVDSLAGKLELKGAKYKTVDDITDLLGSRVVAFYADDVDKVAALAENLFSIDWNESVDKRKMHELNSFGYNSLHYICRIPKELYFDPAHPELNEMRFELQMRTALQHVWATMNHDTGYKSGVEIPSEYIRNLNRLAGMLELADDEFGRTRTMINDYRRKVEALVKDGKFEEVGLNGDTFKSYLEMKPFDKLIRKIAAINQAEIHYSTSMPYLEVLKDFGFKTLGDVEALRKDYAEDAYQLALRQIGGTDLDIISSTVAIQDLCVVYVLKTGGGEKDLARIFECISGPNPSNVSRARRLIETASTLSFMHK